jgi:hypothetical protein
MISAHRAPQVRHDQDGLVIEANGFVKLDGSGGIQMRDETDFQMDDEALARRRIHNLLIFARADGKTMDDRQWVTK